MTIVFHARLYGRFIEIKSNPRRKKLHRRNQSSFLEGSFNNGDNAKATIQLWRERQPQHLEGWFFPTNRPICLHVNSTSIIRLGKRNNLEGIELNYWMDQWKNYWIKCCAVEIFTCQGYKQYTTLKIYLYKIYYTLDTFLGCTKSYTVDIQSTYHISEKN